jgi:hypothetical protein
MIFVALLIILVLVGYVIVCRLLLKSDKVILKILGAALTLLGLYELSINLNLNCY